MNLPKRGKFGCCGSNVVLMAYNQSAHAKLNRVPCGLAYRGASVLSARFLTYEAK